MRADDFTVEERAAVMRAVKSRGRFENPSRKRFAYLSLRKYSRLSANIKCTR